MSLLAFLGAGITHLSKETAQDPVTQAPLDLGRTVRNGLRWLVRAQHSDGAMADPGDRDAAETHDLATLVLAEFFGLTASPLVKDPADRALQFLEAHRPGPEQPRAFLWAVYAFETAARSGLRDRSALQDLLSRGGTPAGDSPSSRAVRILCATLSGGQTAEEDSTALLGASLPGDAEEVFHVTTALFLSDGPDSGHSGKFWKSWNRKITETLLASRPGASARCAAGSWDGGDRVIVTALRVLTLEVYYRYDFVVWRRK